MVLVKSRFGEFSLKITSADNKNFIKNSSTPQLNLIADQPGGVDLLLQIGYRVYGN
jgi:hypothetical protein